MLKRPLGFDAMEEGPRMDVFGFSPVTHCHGDSAYRQPMIATCITHLDCLRGPDAVLRAV